MTPTRTDSPIYKSKNLPNNLKAKESHEKKACNSGMLCECSDNCHSCVESTYQIAGYLHHKQDRNSVS